MKTNHPKKWTKVLSMSITLMKMIQVLLPVRNQYSRIVIGLVKNKGQQKIVYKMSLIMFHYKIELYLVLHSSYHRLPNPNTKIDTLTGT